MARSNSRYDCSMLASFAAPQRGRFRMRRSAASSSVSWFCTMTWRLIEPAQRVFFVVELKRFFGELERVLRVEHDGELLGAGRVLTRHDRAGMRSMWNAARMQCDRGRSIPRRDPKFPRT